MSIASEEYARTAMDRMYRLTRHVYDITRKYYLLGRDTLIEQLNAGDGETVIEVGCGTARNLIKMARKYPNAHFYGIDASAEMLKTAGQSIERAGLSDKLKIAVGFAQTFDAATTFGIQKPLDKIVFSYALSIIPPWKESLDHALNLIKSGGEIHIVDFGGQQELPSFFRRFVFWWLEKFHVYYKPEIEKNLRQMELEKRGILKIRYLYRGYAYYAVFKKF